MAYINGKEILVFNVICDAIVPDKPKLEPPTISLEGDILTIIDTSGVAEKFDILVDGVVNATVGRGVT